MPPSSAPSPLATAIAAAYAGDVSSLVKMTYSVPDDSLRAAFSEVVEALVNTLTETALEREVHANARAADQVNRDEVARLKGLKGKPDIKANIKPSGLVKGTETGASAGPDKGLRPGSAKRAKTEELPIDEVRYVEPEGIPAGARRKGYRDFVVQELVICTYNVRYRLAEYQRKDGTLLVGKLPMEVGGRHFGPNLRATLIYLHQNCRVTQPLLLEAVREWGIDISSGQIDLLLGDGQSVFAEEKNDVLEAGVSLRGWVTTDDTGARHAGHNGYTTHIGNDLFAWFETTDSKSRVNFLGLFQREPVPGYVVSPVAVAYYREIGLPEPLIAKLSDPAAFPTPPLYGPSRSTGEAWRWAWRLDCLGIRNPTYRRVATEGALLGALYEAGLRADLAVISDGARQFAVFAHGLCWVHAERLVHKLLPQTEADRESVERTRTAIWALFAELKTYKKTPDSEKAVDLAFRFDALFTTKTGYATLDELLGRLFALKAELLLVLTRPEVPLHTNSSEFDIREFVMRRKISGGTRSNLGRQCRDTFLSLKATCRKLGVSFWDYLKDRVSGLGAVPPLPDIMAWRAAASP